MCAMLTKIERENFWLKNKVDQLEEKLEKSETVREQLKAQVREQELTIGTLSNSVKEELNKLKAALASMISRLDEKLEDMDMSEGVEEDANDSVGTIKELDEDLILEALEDQIEFEHSRVMNLIKDASKSPADVVFVLAELVKLTLEKNFKEMKSLLEKCKIDSNLPDLLEQYQQELTEYGRE